MYEDFNSGSVFPPSAHINKTNNKNKKKPSRGYIFKELLVIKF